MTTFIFPTSKLKIMRLFCFINKPLNKNQIDNLPLCCLPRKAVFVVQFSVLVLNNDNITSKKYFA
jgi:exosome complex RNA-binding protein Rrp42 (RNase PH superfamily)